MKELRLEYETGVGLVLRLFGLRWSSRGALRATYRDHIKSWFLLYGVVVSICRSPAVQLQENRLLDHRFIPLVY